jgi:AcrR family transcriptional regulator
MQSSRRDEILQAASGLANSQGVAHLTLEGIAQEAGMSKGGLLYHFPSKEALITGMLDQYLSAFEARIEQNLAEEAEDRPGRWLRAYVRASFQESWDEPSAVTSVLAAAVTMPSLLDRLRERYAFWLEQATCQGLSSQTAMLVMQATDGIWYSDLLGLKLLGKEERQQVEAQLLLLIDRGEV